MPHARRDYTFSQWKSPGSPGQCYSEVASGDTLTVYTSDSTKSWAPFTRRMNTSTIVIGAHINGWIFAEQTSTPAVPTVTASVTPSCSSSSISGSTSTIVFGIGVALAVVGLVVLAAGMLIMRKLRQTLPRVAQSAVHVPNTRLALPQEPSQYRHMHQTGHGALFAPAPARARHGTLEHDDKQIHELDGSHPNS